ncbi:MAG: transcriptional repressor [Actinobacteria bacterium]|nr:transcriptional repressor [Actinomycetota bacterium]
MSKSTTRVVSALKRAGGFASAQEVHQLMVRQGDRIGLTTIYRALQNLLDENVVDLLRRDGGEAIYRLCGEEHHHHLRCKRCGKTVEISDRAIEKWAREVAGEYGFRDVGHTAEFFGTCSEC